MIEVIETIVLFVLTIFLGVSGMIFCCYLFDNKKQKGMIIFTLIMFISSLVLCVIFILVVNNIPPVVGTMIAR